MLCATTYDRKLLLSNPVHHCWYQDQVETITQELHRDQNSNLPSVLSPRWWYTPLCDVDNKVMPVVLQLLSHVGGQAMPMAVGRRTRWLPQWLRRTGLDQKKTVAEIYDGQ